MQPYKGNSSFYTTLKNVLKVHLCGGWEEKRGPKILEDPKLVQDCWASPEPLNY